MLEIYRRDVCLRHDASAKRQGVCRSPRLCECCVVEKCGAFVQSREWKGNNANVSQGKRH